MNLAEQAYDLIRRDIITCTLQPGQQIVQGQLAEMHGLGMTPVREALQRLSYEGLVQAVPRAGYVVSHITLTGLRELFELRSILETAAVRMAIIRGSDEQLRKIYDSANFTYVFTDPGGYIRFLERNREFHCSIAGLTGNRRLANELAHILDGLNRAFHLGMGMHDNAEEMRSEHLALASALLARDSSLAVSLLNNQIAQSVNRVVETLANSMGSELGGELAAAGQGIQSMILGDKAS